MKLAQIIRLLTSAATRFGISKHALSRNWAILDKVRDEVRGEVAVAQAYKLPELRENGLS
jgi:hypothetical protein